MNFYVYMIIAKKINRYITYVGYSKDLKKRISLHNSSKGAKFTKGANWTMIYKKKYNSKSKAMREEYKLKKNYLLRSKIKIDYLQNENIHFTSI